jgi:response regulator of citrate/malate metabolism
MIKMLNQVIAQLEQLPESKQEDIAQFILSKLEENSVLPQGVRGENLNRYAGIIAEDDLQLMSQAIAENCDNSRTNF